MASIYTSLSNFSGLWPAEQRFDFFVRERPATERDVLKALARARAGPSEHHKAVRWALGELTGRAGPGLGKAARRP